MLGLAATILAAATAQVAPSLTSAAPWWEKVTYTFSGDGAQQSCRYESSLSGSAACDPEFADSPLRAPPNDSAGAFTRIVMERRFTPEGQPVPFDLESGDTLLGGQVLALSIDGTGAVRGCRLVGASGDVRPAYGCDQARAERFEASARRDRPQVRSAYMTIVVYGHEANLA